MRSIVGPMPIVDEHDLCLRSRQGRKQSTQHLGGYVRRQMFAPADSPLRALAQSTSDRVTRPADESVAARSSAIRIPRVSHWFPPDVSAYFEQRLQYLNKGLQRLSR